MLHCQTVSFLEYFDLAELQQIQFVGIRQAEQKWSISYDNMQGNNDEDKSIIYHLLMHTGWPRLFILTNAV
jgi:hypothetical protein